VRARNARRDCVLAGARDESPLLARDLPSILYLHVPGRSNDIDIDIKRIRVWDRLASPTYYPSLKATIFVCVKLYRVSVQLVGNAASAVACLIDGTN
jgi:hypothetical protein